MTNFFVPVILCGGSGTRLWPLSRSACPKQFVEFEKGKTLFKSTLDRVAALPGAKSSFVVCNKAHRFLVQRNLEESSCCCQVITEPVARNTAPAIALAAFEAIKLNPAAVLFVLPSDHIVEGRASFSKAVKDAVMLAKEGYLVTFGLRPTGPETGYGYIAAGRPVSEEGYRVDRFIEKPTIEKAREMLDAGDFFWNSGMFVFQATAYLDALRTSAPTIYKQCEIAIEKAQIVGDFLVPDSMAMEDCPANSIDYAVMEKTDKAAVVPLNIVWNDLGAWSAIHNVAEKDDDRNVLAGDAIAVGCSNSYLYSSRRLVAAVGLRDMAVIETPDAVLVAPFSCAQEVKKIVTELKERNRSETELPAVVQRPWGTYEVIAHGEHYQSKRIVVNPGEAFSLQLHHHRSEHWTIVEGEAEITVGDKADTFRKNESVYIPLETVHRLENKSNAPVVLIEVQCGDYLGEDDIVRFSDFYSRT